MYSLLAEASLSHFPEVAHFLLDQGIEVSQDAFHCVLRSGALNIAERLWDRGLRWNDATLVAVLRSGQLKSLIWMRKKGFPVKEAIAALSDLALPRHVCHWILNEIYGGDVKVFKSKNFSASDYVR